MVDGVGIGSAMVANKIRGIRAANCHNIFETKNSREHNDANVLTLGGQVIGPGLAIEMVRLWLETPFAGERHKRRVDKIIRLESGISPTP
jgi:ribose 5-phosphate isomerase B